MLVFVGKRLATMILTMVAVSLLLFLLLEISPGSVATKVLGQFSTLEQRELWLEAHGYYRPAYVRYFEWLANFASGDFGNSIRFKVPVGEVMWPRLWNTAILGFWTFAIMIPLSLILGVLAGMREASKLDRTISVSSIQVESSTRGRSTTPSRAKVSIISSVTYGWRTETSEDHGSASASSVALVCLAMFAI